MKGSRIIRFLYIKKCIPLIDSFLTVPETLGLDDRGGCDVYPF